jgi:hypothetical protein
MTLVFQNGFLVDIDAKFEFPAKKVEPVRLCPNGCTTAGTNVDDGTPVVRIALETVAGETEIPGLVNLHPVWGHQMPLSATFKMCPKCGHSE